MLGCSRFEDRKMSEGRFSVVGMTCTISPPDAHSAVADGAAVSTVRQEPASVASAARRLLAGPARPGWARSDPELVRDVADLFALRAQVDALLLDAVGEVQARGLAGRRGCPSTRAWLRWAHRIAPHEAKRLVRTATALRKDLPAVAQAMSEGAVSLAQAEVIVHAIADLPAGTPVACRPQAEQTMIDQARTFDPMILARIGRRLAELIDPTGSRPATRNPSSTKRRTLTATAP